MAKNERELGKAEIERTALAPFLESYPHFTDNKIDYIGKSESPDFWVARNGKLTGIEVTEVRKQDEGHYLETFAEIAMKKETTFERNGVFRDPIILVGYSYSPPLWDLRRYLEGSPGWIDFTDFKFSEIWLVDHSDEYSGRHYADLHCLSPISLRGFYGDESQTRKPFG
jgi:hypothetical protein